MEKLSHAYIVSSASENARMGKAFYLAEKMLCQSEGERPCGVCRDCRKVKARVHPDLAVVERITDDKGKQKKEILVDQVRAMGADAYVLPNEAAEKVAAALDAAGLRVEKDLRNEKIGKKIAEGRSQKIPYLLILGDKEAESGTVAVRSRGGDEGVMALDDFIARVNEEVRTKKN